MAHLYYLRTGETPVEGSSARLVGEEARHAAVVSRLGVGEDILIGDGEGTLARASATTVSPQEIVVDVRSTTFHPRPTTEIWLVQALAKGDRDELALQTCTELGVDRIIPWQAQRSVSQWRGDKVTKGVARWSKIATEASKQALRAWVPRVDTVVSTKDLAQLGGSHELLVLDPDAPEALSSYTPPTGKPVVVIVGPEGGVDPAERELLIEAGATAWKLGSTVLRTSSAGPAALALLNSSLGRW